MLETAEAGQPSAELRFPVQLVSRSRFGAKHEHRGYLGRVESGHIAVGDIVVAWPQNAPARVTEIITLDGTLERAGAGRSITVVLDRQIDVARGDMISHAQQPPTVTRKFTARLAWLDQEPLVPGRRYALKHGTQTVKATVEALDSRLDLETLVPGKASTLEFNDIGTVRIATGRALIADRYADNRATGSFILIDEATNHTVASGMISELDRG